MSSHGEKKSRDASPGRNQDRDDRKPRGQGKSGARRFRPRKDPILPDEPTRQPVKTNPARKPPSDSDLDALLKPKFKSTTATAPKNDPADIKETLILGLSGLAFRPAPLKFTLDFSGYVDLADACYSALTAKDRYLGRTITPGMWNYYACTLLWARLYRIREAQGKDTERIWEQFRNALPERCFIPKPMSVYLASIGNVVDPNQREWDLDTKLVDITNQIVAAGRLPFRGFYGACDAASHWKYSSKPAPALAITRMGHEIVARNLQDLRNSWYPQGGMNPPANTQTSQPNKNCLGWDYVYEPHHDAQRAYSQLGINATWRNDAAHPNELTMTLAGIQHLGNYPFLPDLIGWVSTKLSNVKDFAFETDFPLSKYGSTSQIGWVKLDDTVDIRPDRWSRGQFSAYTAHQLPASIGCAVGVFRFRVYRSNSPMNAELSAPYMFEENVPVPDAWRLTNDTNFQHGDVTRWNQRDFSLPEINGASASQAFVERYVSGT